MAIVVVFLLVTLIFAILWHHKHVFRLAWQLPGPFPILEKNLVCLNVIGEKFVYFVKIDEFPLTHTLLQN